jgi:hypothetical protein
MASGMAALATPASSSNVRAHILIVRVGPHDIILEEGRFICSHPVGMCGAAAQRPNVPGLKLVKEGQTGRRFLDGGKLISLLVKF